MYEEIRLNQLNRSVNQVEVIVQKDGDLSAIFDIALDNEACVLVLSENGSVVYSADVLKDCILHQMSYYDVLSVVISAKENNGEIYGMYSKNNPFVPGKISSDKYSKYDENDPKSMFYCKEVKNGDIIKGYIIINIQLTPVNATISTIHRQLYIIMVFMILFSAVLAGIIARKVAKPIEKITEEAHQLAIGDYEMVFDAVGYAEINQLSQTLTKAAEDLAKVESLRKDFIANVSHDLRTPLTLIGGYAEVMRDIPGENNSENAQAIIDETNRLSGLVNDLLDMTKLQSGAVPMKKAEYNLTKTLRRTVSRMNEMLKKEGYYIDFTATDEVSVTADEIRISQCFYNILINAINYTGEDKKIFVTQETKDNFVKVSVTDTGKGVEEKDLPYVWERYYKNDKNHKRSVTGTGLGLSIVRSVIKAHNGKYGAYNTADKGACFWFEIPNNQ